MANHSHYKDPISTDNHHVGGFSREAGGATDEVKQKVIDTIISKARDYGLSDQDAANLVAIAKVESKFNPDAATPGHQSSASGVFQITDSTAHDAQKRLDGTTRINGHQLRTYDRFDLNSNVEHGIAIYMDKKAIANSNDADIIYKTWNTNPAEYNKFLGQLKTDSSKYFGEIQSAGRLKLASTGAGTPSIDDANHPVHALYKQALKGMQALDAKIDRKSDQLTQNAAAALAVEAHRDGLKRIDHVTFGDSNADKIFAVQGKPGTAHSKVTGVDTVAALNTPVADSSKAYAQAAEPRAHQQTQPPQQSHNDPVQQQQGPVMSR